MFIGVRYVSIVFLFLASIDVALTQGKVPEAPADKLLAIINEERTARELSTLKSNLGLACIAQEYIRAYKGDCDAMGGPDEKKPPESAFAKTFALECGVNSSTLAPITGQFFGCKAKYVHPPQAFSEILITNKESLDILYSESHTQVGVAVTGHGAGGRPPYFWCVLFSNGKPNSTFVFEHGATQMIDIAAFAEEMATLAEKMVKIEVLMLLIIATYIVGPFWLRRHM